MTTTATATEHETWCTSHITEYDSGHEVQVCKASITVRGVTVGLEDSPSWPDAERGQILPPELPEWTWCNAAWARALSAALGLAATIIEGNHNADLLVDQVQR